MYRRHYHPAVGVQSAFTLVELMLSLGFIGILLVTITLTTTHIMGMYNKGATLREVNQVTRSVVRDMQQSIAGTSTMVVRYRQAGDGTPQVASGLRMATRYAQHHYVNRDGHGRVVGGRLCTGTYSYVWNLRAAFPDARDLEPVAENATPKQGVQYLRLAGRRMQPVRFMRIVDADYSLCKYSESDNNGTILPLIRGQKYLNVFGEGNTNLLLYNIAITTPLNSPVVVDETTQGERKITTGSIGSLSTFYAIRLTLGTMMGDENITTQDASCQPPAQAQLNRAEYCAINSIQFVARTGQLGL